MKNNIRDLKIFATDIRITILKGLKGLGFGHVGGSMSMVELMAALYGECMNIDAKNPDWEDRDWYIQSKGHAGPAVYATLALKGYFPYEEIYTINQPETNLPSHCDRNKTPGIDMTTGSLGQGMSTAIGVALGNKLKSKNNYTFLLLGDGECNEGQVWEGALFAPQHKLDHLIAFIDSNKKQLDGYCKDICDLGDIRQKFEDFGWHAQEVDGHDIEEIINAIEKAKAVKEKPSMIVLDTEKGRGCTFTEGVLFNHHVKFTKEQADEAITALENYKEML
ncbi:MAG: transketolase [Eubacteriales bacterium]|nr:transketolase [Eubacteriales bacterium]MDD4583426.1 transketolase [Eubacteriales bacterium]